MSDHFTPAAMSVLTLAEQVARQFNHGYVGTEHVLLALASGDPGLAARLLRRFGADQGAIARQIEQLVHRGPASISADRALPRTPRVLRAIDYAREQAAVMNHGDAAPEHLLLGLLRERDGVAGKVLMNLGVKLPELWIEVHDQSSLGLSKVVERAVRPVRAGVTAKRRMREELLSHLRAAYDEEASSHDDLAAAIARAVQRFGDPAALSCELQTSLSAGDRIAYYIERWLGWRAPESAARYVLRQALQCVVMIGLLVVAQAALLYFDSGGNVATAIELIRPSIATLLFLPVDLFVIGLLYFKMRDAIFGAFGARRSRLDVVVCGVLIAVTTFVSVLGFVAISTGDVGRATRTADACTALAAAVAVALIQLLVARTRGRTEITDAIWACLNIDRDPSGGGPAEAGSTAAA